MTEENDCVICNKGILTRGSGDLYSLDEGGFHRNDERFIVMQCTGLKDKNGRLVFEGDILKIQGREEHHYTLRPIRWEDVNACFDFIWWNLVSCDNVEDGVVVGNIYENPDLLREIEEKSKETSCTE
jgi:hypothetical protein